MPPRLRPRAVGERHALAGRSGSLRHTQRAPAGAPGRQTDRDRSPCRPHFRGAAPARHGAGLGVGDVDYLVEVGSEEDVRSLVPDFPILRKAAAGFIVTARGSSPTYDFVSRYFAPFVGIDEDPVTGAAHCALVPFWARRLGKNAMTAYQASARGGVVHGRVEGDRVLLSGNAVTVLRRDLVDHG